MAITPEMAELFFDQLSQLEDLGAPEIGLTENLRKAYERALKKARKSKSAVVVTEVPVDATLDTLPEPLEDLGDTSSVSSEKSDTPETVWSKLEARLEESRAAFKALRTQLMGAFANLEEHVSRYGATPATRLWQSRREEVMAGFTAFDTAMRDVREDRRREEEARRIDRKIEEMQRRAKELREGIKRPSQPSSQHQEQSRPGKAPPPPPQPQQEPRHPGKTHWACYICGHPGVRYTRTCPNRANHPIRSRD